MSVILKCPSCDAPLNAGMDNTYWCPDCHRDWVVSYSEAYATGGINTRAPFHRLVLEIDAIFRKKRQTPHKSTGQPTDGLVA